MGRELEYKYAATPQKLESIAAQYGPFRQLEMCTTYYDTPSRSLSARHCTLRLRQENGVCICTLKMPLPDGSRAEFECNADTIEEGIAAIPQAAALIDGPVEPVCGARFTRLAALVNTGDGTAELALDRGVLLGGGREAPLCELELEHKTGNDIATMVMGHSLSMEFDLPMEQKSKFARAMALSEGGSHG